MICLPLLCPAVVVAWTFGSAVSADEQTLRAPGLLPPAFSAGTVATKAKVDRLLVWAVSRVL